MAPIAVDFVPAAATPPPGKSKAGSAGLYSTGSANPIVESGNGLYYTLSDGRVVLDAVAGGVAVNSIGMANDEVVQAMADQARKLGFAYHQMLVNERGEELAAFLTSRSDGAFSSAAFLCSGSEAMETVLKVCRQYWVEKGQMQRKYIIARFPSYHGNTLGALAITYVPQRRDIYTNFFSDFCQHVPTPMYKRKHHEGESEEQYSERMASKLEAKILELGPENVIAFVAEPVSGAAVGVMPPPKGYFPAIDRVLKKYDILLAMDEVKSGSGRTGQLFAFQAVAEGVKPDVLAMAKGLGGGYVTISSVLVSHKVAETISEGGWRNSHTYQNHPVACATALKVQEIIERDALLVNVRERGVELMAALKANLDGVKAVFDIRGTGLFLSVEFDTPSTLVPRMAERVKEKCLKNGIVVLALTGIIDGTEGDSCTIAPAYNVTSEQVQQIASLFGRSVKEVVVEL